MSDYTFSWFTVTDDGTAHGDGFVRVHSVAEHTGRTARAATVTVENQTGGETASFTVNQSPTDAFIEISHIEDSGGSVFRTLSGDREMYYLVGTSNCDLLNVVETSGSYTSVNDSSDAPISGGYTIVESSGTSHNHITVNGAISPDYGAEAAFTFRIPFYTAVNESSSTRTVSIRVTDGVSVSDVISIEQGVSSGGGEESI